MASQAQIEQRQQAARTHGMKAIEYRGEDAMVPTQRSRLQELKEQLASEPGRVEYRQDLAAFCALLVETGMSDVREQIARKENIWTGGPLKSIGVFINAVIRLLDNWPKDSKPPEDIGVVVGRMVEQHEQQNS